MPQNIALLMSYTPHFVQIGQATSKDEVPDASTCQNRSINVERSLYSLFFVLMICSLSTRIPDPKKSKPPKMVKLWSFALFFFLSNSIRILAEGSAYDYIVVGSGPR